MHIQKKEYLHLPVFLRLISKPLDFGRFKLTYFDQIKLVEIDYVN